MYPIRCATERVKFNLTSSMKFAQLVITNGSGDNYVINYTINCIINYIIITECSGVFLFQLFNVRLLEWLGDKMNDIIVGEGFLPVFRAV